MTEQERKEAIQKLESLHKQGILTDDEYVQKIARMSQPVQKDDEPEKPAHTGRFVLAFIGIVLIVGIMAVISTQNENRKTATTPTMIPLHWLKMRKKQDEYLSFVQRQRRILAGSKRIRKS